MNQEWPQTLHTACIRNEPRQALQIIQAEMPSAQDINECLFSAAYYGNIEVLSHIIEIPTLDPRIFDLTALLERSIKLKQFEIATYLIDRPGMGEHDLNVVLYSRSWQEYEPLKAKTDHILKLISQTNQALLRHQSFMGRLDYVKHIVESKDYYDLYPSLCVAAISNKIEVLAYLFNKVGQTLRHEQIRRLIVQADSEACQWLEKAILHQNLGENLVEKEGASRLKI